MGLTILTILYVTILDMYKCNGAENVLSVQILVQPH